MEFETMVPSHGSFALLGCSQEDLVTMTSLDMTHLDGRRVDDGESCTFAGTMNLLKQREFDGHHFLTFYEAVVRHSIWEILLHMCSDKEIEML